MQNHVKWTNCNVSELLQVILFLNYWIYQRAGFGVRLKEASKQKKSVSHLAGELY